MWPRELAYLYDAGVSPRGANALLGKLAQAGRYFHLRSKYPLTGIFQSEYIKFNETLAIVMRELHSDEKSRRHEVNTMSRNDPGMTMAMLSALAEPNRMKIVELLRDGPLSVGEIADRLGLRQPQASKHLKVLSDNEVLEVKVDANRRIYRLRSEPFQALDSWVKSFRSVMEDRYDNLEAYLRELQSEGNP